MDHWLIGHWLRVSGSLAAEANGKAPNCIGLLLTAGRGGRVLVPDGSENTAPHAAAFKLAFTHDRVRRFVPISRNRVVHVRELEAYTLAATRLWQSGLSWHSRTDWSICSPWIRC